MANRKKTHKTKDGRIAKKGFYYNINKKRKEGRKMRKKGAKGAPTAAAFKRSAKTAKKPKKRSNLHNAILSISDVTSSKNRRRLYNK